jgi:hypothetical protein
VISLAQRVWNNKYIKKTPTDRQLAFLCSGADELLYGGAAGGGKSDALLMAALMYVDVPGYNALLLRREFVHLTKADGLIQRSKEWLAGTGAVYRVQEKKWIFPSGATLEFGYLSRYDDVSQFQSAQYQFIGFDELTHFGELEYLYMFSRLRRVEGHPVPLRMYSATNPA